MNAFFFSDQWSSSFNCYYQICLAYFCNQQTGRSPLRCVSDIWINARERLAKTLPSLNTLSSLSKQMVLTMRRFHICHFQLPALTSFFMELEAADVTGNDQRWSSLLIVAELLVIVYLHRVILKYFTKLCML